MKLFLPMIIIFMTPPLVLADAYGPLSKDKDLEVVKEKKWSVEGGLKFGVLNANIRSQGELNVSFLSYFSSPSRSTSYFGDSLIPTNEKSRGDFSTPVLNFSYKYSKSMFFDIGLYYGITLPSSTQNRDLIGIILNNNLGFPLINSSGNPFANDIKRQLLPLLGSKYFLSDTGIKPFLSVHFGRADYTNSLKFKANIDFLILGGGLRYEFSESTYWDTTLSYYELKSSEGSWRGNKYNATGYGLDLIVGYKF